MISPFLITVLPPFEEAQFSAYTLKKKGQQAACITVNEIRLVRRLKKWNEIE